MERSPFVDCATKALTNVMLPESAAIVLAYAVDIAYTWNRKPYYAPITITGNKAVSRRCEKPADDRWIRVVALQSIADGPRRWRILTEFHPPIAGFIAIGISKAETGCLIVNGTEWSNVSTSDDFLISTVSCDAARYTAQLFLGGRTFTTEFARRNDSRTVALVAVDPVGQTMTVTFRCADGFSRVVTVSLPDSDDVWRPCVTISGAVTATILPWPDD
jgi:hypothetical protein